MTSKNETEHWIAYKGNSTYELTEPEMKVKAILEELGYGYRIQEKIPVVFDYQIATHVDIRLLKQPPMFTIDLFIVEHKICVEVDGIHHKTKKQESKTKWRDEQLIANGYKVLHIDADYTEAKYGYPSKLRVALSDALLKLRAGSMKERLD